MKGDKDCGTWEKGKKGHGKGGLRCLARGGYKVIGESCGYLLKGGRGLIGGGGDCGT